MKKLCIIAIALAGMSASVFAQVGTSTTATASATVVATIEIQKDFDLNFGNIAVTTSGGTVVLNPNGAGRTESGGVTLPAQPGTVSAAEFTISGEDNYTFDVTLPENGHVITDPISEETMTVGSFTSFPADSWALNGSGVMTLFVGATLTVDNNQVPGTYISETPFDVYVNYN